MKKREILPTLPDRVQEETLAKELLDSFFESIYKPLLSILELPKDKLTNATKKRKGLVEAIESYQVEYQGSEFKGKFNADISKDLRQIKARWNPKSRTWTLKRVDLPPEIRSAVTRAEMLLREKTKAILTALDNVQPKLIRPSTEAVILKTIEKTTNKNANKLKSVSIPLQMTEERKKVIAEEYTKNLEKYIVDFSGKEIIKLRENIIKMVAKGYRYDAIAKEIRKSYGVTENKSYFLARQETNLLVVSLNKEQFTSAGSVEYRWKCVTGTADHPVRPMHKRLDGTIQLWSSPPITDENGNRNHAGEDYNCFTGESRVFLDNTTNKIFRHFYTGELAVLTLDDGRSISPTRNHPVLTLGGWVPAHLLKVGDYVVSPKVHGRNAIAINTQNTSSTFQDFFNAIGFFGEIFSDSLRASDFHGDVTDKKVDVININHELILNRAINLFEKIIELRLKLSDPEILEVCSLDKSGFFGGPTPNCLVSFLGDLSLFLKACVFKSKNIGLATASRIQALINNHPSYYVSTNIETITQRKYAFTAFECLDNLFIERDFVGGGESPFNLNADQMELFSKSFASNSGLTGNFGDGNIFRSITINKIVDKRFMEFSGHVYNLENKRNWYTVENIICHNCRCVAIPIFK